MPDLPSVPEAVTLWVCPDCGERANAAMWGPECTRHRKDGRPANVKCLPVEYVPAASGSPDAVREALEEIDRLAHSFVLNDEDAQARIQAIADTARAALAAVVVEGDEKEPEGESREADAIEARVRSEQEKEALPGGLFGTYWKGGLEGRDAARRARNSEWDAELDRAKQLRAAAPAPPRGSLPVEQENKPHPSGWSMRDERAARRLQAGHWRLSAARCFAASWLAVSFRFCPIPP